MALYVEVHCDAMKYGRKPGSAEARCWSHRNDNPEGFSVAEARSEARRQGWSLGRDRSQTAVCPGCLRPDREFVDLNPPDKGRGGVKSPER